MDYVPISGTSADLSPTLNGGNATIMQRDAHVSSQSMQTGLGANDGLHRRSIPPDIEPENAHASEEFSEEHQRNVDSLNQNAK